MEQTIIQVGNSIGVIIPQPIRSKIGLNVGDKVHMDPKGKNILISHSRKRSLSGVDAKFMKMLDAFATTHADVLRELARR